jgi:hypothetical protein
LLHAIWLAGSLDAATVYQDSTWMTLIPRNFSIPAASSPWQVAADAAPVVSAWLKRR